MDVSALLPFGASSRNRGTIAPTSGLGVLAKSGRDFHIKAGDEPRLGASRPHRADKGRIINTLA